MIEKATFRDRMINATIETLAIVDGLLLTQPRQMLESFSRRKETGGMRSPRQAIARGALGSLVIAAFPVGVGLLTYAVTRRADIAVAAAGAAYVVEGTIMDFSEAMGYLQASSYYGYAIENRWTIPLQRSLARLTRSDRFAQF